MYNGAIHETAITPRTPSSRKSSLDKKANLDELSQQMKVNIAQLKSLLGIKAKDDEYDLKSLEGFTFFGKSFNRELDQRELELKLLQDDIANLYVKRHRSPRRVDRDAVSLPSTPRTSLMLEGPLSISIPSKTSAFSPRFSTSSPSGKELRQREFDTDMSSLRRYSRENDEKSAQRVERLNGHSCSQRKSSSSLSSSAKVSPRNPSYRDSRSSSSNNRRLSRNETTENSTSSGRRNQKSRDSASSLRSSSSQNKSQALQLKLKRDSGSSNRGSASNTKSKRPSQTITRERSTRKKQSYYSDSDDRSSSSSDGSAVYESSLSDEDVMREEVAQEKSVARESRGTAKTKSDSRTFKFEQVERKLLQLQQRCDLLENENENIKKDQKTKNSKKIADLKHRNSELVDVARRLEKKAKTLHVENNKRMTEVTHTAQDFEEQKKNFANIAAKMEIEHKNEISAKNKEMKTWKHQVGDLKKALKDAKRAQVSKDGDDATTAALKQSQKESLQLQKLAAAANKKVTIRSLSMPVTARQKILEESNRTLRKQLSQLEENYKQACNGDASAEELKAELESAKSKCETLEKEVKEAKIQTVNLESQLQIAKVETSDTNIKLNELQKSFNQLQSEYSTVHEQLSVAIKERDAAISQCKDNSTRMNEMEVCIKNMQNHVGGGGDSDRTQYQMTLEKLQAKVMELEKQCEQQNETNRLLNVQLMTLMKGSPHSSPVEEKGAANVSPSSLEAKSPSQTKQQFSPIVKQLEIADSNGAVINANKLKDDTVQYQAKTSGQVHDVPGIAVGNEDTEVEDFIEEELTHAMDHHDSAKLRVYIAKYTYNPYEGPNDSPEVELPLVAGDYVYVYGTMDEDGFFEGELMNGRRGLVPSNFLEAVHDDGYEFGSKPSMKMENSVSKCTSGELSQSESLISSCTSLGSGRFSQRGDMSSSDQSVPIHGVLPYPKRLRIDKQLSHSLIIGWISPHLGDGEHVDEYHIFVNGEFRSAVNGSKQKAVVENIHHDQPNRISVCAVSQWGISDENLCVLSHGRGADMAPTSVRMEKVGASSARVAWTPSSSQQCHVVTVEEERPDSGSTSGLKNPTHMTHTVSSPAYRLTFGNLRPNIRYKVTVNAKGSPDEPRSFTRFTTPEAGPPDPPLGVQIEECQNANYLLITWFPVTLNTLGTSNGVVVKGYSIHVADTKVCEVQSATMDQCTIRAQTLADAFKDQLSIGPEKSLYRLSKPSKTVLRWNKHVPPSITIKTHAVNGQESDFSDPCVISQELYTKLVDLVKDSIQTPSPKLSEGRNRKRPPLMRSLESTDVDISFSSDISIPGLNSPRPGSTRKNGRSGTDSSDSGGKSHLSRSKLLEETRIVPSIEITHDTSSDEDPALPNGHGSRSSSNKSLANRHSQQKDATKVSSSSSSVKTAKNVVENHRSAYKNPDNDDAVSVSSSHTSSSNGGDPLKHTKPGSVAHRAARVIQQHRLQRGESAEYSNPEDYILSSSNGTARKNFHLTGSDKHSVAAHYSPDRARRHPHRHHHHHIRGSGRRPHSVASDHSQGSHRSHSSTRRGYNHFHHGKHNGRRDIIRQSTMSSQSGSEFASEIESTYPIDVDKNSVSLFVALYTYDPHLMSPNTDTYEEELSFSEGQLIKVYGTKDEDGFYYGETTAGTRGYVPCNMVSEVEVESMQMLQDLHERGHLPSASPDEDEQSTSEAKTKSGASQIQNGVEQVDGSKDGLKKRYFLALFDYDPTHLSPNIDVDIEISFRRGDLITVYGNMDDDGFYKGKLGSKEGLVPSNFLEEVSEQEAESVPKKSETIIEKAVSQQQSTQPSLSPVPKPRLNQNSVTTTNHRMNEPNSTYSPPSTVNPNRVDNAVSRKKGGGIVSKGKKLFKKLGGSQDGKRR